MTPSAPDAAPAAAVQRRTIRYIDQTLQMRLLVALVALEVVVLSAAGWVLWRRLDALVEESVYRVHFGGQLSMYSQLLGTALVVVFGMLVANAIALLVAHQVWNAHVNRILAALRDELDRARRLDFGAGPSDEPRHQVVATARAWRAAERERHLALRRVVDAWERTLASEASTDADCREALLACRRQLPRRRAT